VPFPVNNCQLSATLASTSSVAGDALRELRWRLVPMLRLRARRCVRMTAVTGVRSDAVRVAPCARRLLPAAAMVDGECRVVESCSTPAIRVVALVALASERPLVFIVLYATLIGLAAVNVSTIRTRKFDGVWYYVVAGYAVLMSGVFDGSCLFASELASGRATSRYGVMLASAAHWATVVPGHEYRLAPMQPASRSAVTKERTSAAEEFSESPPIRWTGMVVHPACARMMRTLLRASAYAAEAVLP